MLGIGYAGEGEVDRDSGGQHSLFYKLEASRNRVLPVRLEPAKMFLSWIYD